METATETPKGQTSKQHTKQTNVDCLFDCLNWCFVCFACSFRFVFCAVCFVSFVYAIQFDELSLILVLFACLFLLTFLCFVSYMICNLIVCDLYFDQLFRINVSNQFKIFCYSRSRIIFKRG